MSYSTDIKESLSQIYDKSKCCREALHCGVMTGARHTYEGSVMFVHESRAILKLFRAVLRKNERFFEEAEIKEVGTNEAVFAKIKDADGFAEFYESVSARLIENKCTGCAGAFLRGMFITCGTITDPEKGYHLELVPADAESYDFTWQMLLLCGLMPKEADRKGKQSIYFKESQQIEDFLGIVGATKATLELMNLKIMRELRNNANRARNCEDANITRIVDAAMKQRMAIEKIEKTVGLDYLPKKLYDAAMLRKTYPEDSVSELAEKAQPPVSKSGMVHRLAKICEIAKEI
ncbi:MAG: DNA-binding protein WhiA [Ruminococcaceae bacterium]|nr:DNA-binding protein WhiA [Oscillospiraceae bacterium]